MDVIRAEAMGTCFGVRDALEAARALERPWEVTIHGELVHNEVVLDELEGRGFRQSSEADRAAVPATPRVLVTAHGVSDRERQRLAAAGKDLVDTTCPLVRRVHGAARALHDEGRLVVVVGRPGHVEVEGIVGDLERFDVVCDESRVVRWDAPRLGVVAQSTTRPEDLRRVVTAIEEANPHADLRVVDTICGPTRQRQAAALALLERVDALVVVGGVRSNNTRQLVELAESRGVPALHVPSAGALDPSRLRGARTVGLTAGTSTLAETVDEVERALRALPDAVADASRRDGATVGSPGARA